MRIPAYLAVAIWLIVWPVAQGKSKAIHVFVALCDNQHQGIVPVPKTLGNGDDPANNLYWGALYGTKAFLKRSKDWTLVATEKRPSEQVLERVILKHNAGQAYLVADASRGREIKKAVQDFLNAAAGKNPATLPCGDASVGIHGAADLVVYIGHNGLMDFTVARPQRGPSASTRQAIILACKSKPFFQPCLAQLQCRAVLLTTGFMAPEAYTLEAALAGWLHGESGSAIKDRAARAYHKYQKCGLKAARRLFYADE
jgi:hypothetical protein